MSQQYDNDNTGLLSRNERKENEKHADFRGQCTVGGEDYWIDGFIRERKDGSGKFFSLRFKPKTPAIQQAPKAAQKAAKAGHGFEDMDNDVPFRDPMARKGFHLAV